MAVPDPATALVTDLAVPKPPVAEALDPVIAPAPAPGHLMAPTAMNLAALAVDPAVEAFGGETNFFPRYREWKRLLQQGGN